MPVGANDLRKGYILDINGTLFQLLDIQHFKLGKGNSEARVRLKLKDFNTGKDMEKVYQTSDSFNRIVVETKTAQYLYNDGDIYHFMDTENYEQMAVNKALLGDQVNYLKDATTVKMMIYQNKPLTIELPNSVELKIVSAPPGHRGDTAQGGSKTAVLETGITVQVPLFVNEGETIKVDTRTGSYLERAG